MFRKIFSYILPVNLLTQKSLINKSIEITWNNGKLVLDTENTNYSYGSLQKILRKGLQAVGFEEIRKMQSILILGVAGGSVIKTLVDEINFKGKIIGVEIDDEMIAIASKYFDLDKIQNLEILTEDAESFMKKHTYIYDLIIIDIFQDKFMPEFLFQKDFISNLLKNLNQKGFIIFNTMVLNNNDEIRNLKYLSQFDVKKLKFKKISKLEKFNELIIITSNTNNLY